jgi:hypothetical protein
MFVGCTGCKVHMGRTILGIKKLYKTGPKEEHRYESVEERKNIVNNH